MLAWGHHHCAIGHTNPYRNRNETEPVKAQFYQQSVLHLHFPISTKPNQTKPKPSHPPPDIFSECVKILLHPNESLMGEGSFSSHNYTHLALNSVNDCQNVHRIVWRMKIGNEKVGLTLAEPLKMSPISSSQCHPTIPTPQSSWSPFLPSIGNLNSTQLAIAVELLRFSAQFRPTYLSIVLLSTCQRTSSLIQQRYFRHSLRTEDRMQKKKYFSIKIIGRILFDIIFWQDVNGN